MADSNSAETSSGGVLRRWWEENRAPVQVTSLFLLFIFVYAIPDIFFSIYPGHAAVLWSRFGGGTVTAWTYDEGFHAKFPWNKIYVYDIRLQEHRERFDVLSKDGLAIDLEASVRFRVFKEGLAELHKNLGPDYVETLLMPEVGSLIREHIAEFEPEELYTEKRAEIEEHLSEVIQHEVKVQYESAGGILQALHVEDVLIRSITLPAAVAKVIEEKLIREQRLLEFDYRLALEEKEKERKRIEAEGIRLFQDIVSEGISEQYLKWKGIDATLELARSSNSKIVVIGSGGDGMPIILGGLDYPPTGATGTAAGAGTGGAGASSGPTSTAIPPSSPPASGGPTQGSTSTSSSPAPPPPP